MRKTPIDFLAADGHKWLLGPEGAGFLFVRGDLIDRLRPIGVGWLMSKRSRSDAFRLPFCVTCWPSRSRSASCSRCVAEWCARIAVRRI